MYESDEMKECLHSNGYQCTCANFSSKIHPVSQRECGARYQSFVTYLYTTVPKLIFSGKILTYKYLEKKECVHHNGYLGTSADFSSKFFGLARSAVARVTNSSV